MPWAEYFVNEGVIDLDSAPPAGVFFNQMSASWHTRGQLSSIPQTRELIAYLETHGWRVLNGGRALAMEMLKVRQHAALVAAGFVVPRTVALTGGAAALR